MGSSKSSLAPLLGWENHGVRHRENRERWDSTKFPLSKSHRKVPGWVLGAARQVEPCNCQPWSHPTNPGTSVKHREAAGKKNREQHNQLNQLEITKESSQAAKLEVDAVRSLELPCDM